MICSPDCSEKLRSVRAASPAGTSKDFFAALAAKAQPAKIRLNAQGRRSRTINGDWNNVTGRRGVFAGVMAEVDFGDSPAETNGPGISITPISSDRLNRKERRERKVRALTRTAACAGIHLMDESVVSAVVHRRSLPDDPW
jgi:hypothetical protein